MQKPQPTAQPTCVETSLARQQHAFDRLPVGQLDQQARGAVLAGVPRPKPRKRGQFRGQCR
jgi:hypothetical protein